MNFSSRRARGFTIVELLIVIVVIAILAAIAIVAYNGIQARARDTERKSDLAAIAKALQIYNIDNNTYNSCGGSSNSGNGYYNHDYDTTGPFKTISQCLIDAKVLSQDLSDESAICSGLTCHTYIKITCGLGTFLYANLETLPQTSTDADDTCQPTYDTTFGSNYIVKVN